MLISMKLNIFELFMLSHVHFAVSAVGVRQRLSTQRRYYALCEMQILFNKVLFPFMATH